MNKEKIMKILLFIWQLPQNLVGLVLVKILKAKHKFYGDIEWYQFERNNWFSTVFSGASFGDYILLPDSREIKHEYGHSVQSRRWGWLYLIVIGIPSVSNNIWDRLAHDKFKTRYWSTKERLDWYYSRYPEKQADKLGGVVR